MSSHQTSDDNIYLIGNVVDKIPGNKLPSNGEVLKLLFYKTRICHLNLHDSATQVIEEVEFFWNNLGLLTKKKARCIELLEKLHKQWSELQKSRNVSSNKQKEVAFVDQLNNLFDIAHADVLNDIDVIRKQFLLVQRKLGRESCLNDITPKIMEQEMKKLQKREKLDKQFLKQELEKENYDKVELISSYEEILQISSQNSIGSYSNVAIEIGHDLYNPFSQLSVSDDSQINEPEEKKAKITRETVNVFTEKLIAVLDKCKISHRDAVRLIIAVAEALNTDPKTLIINKTSVQRYHERIREAKALNIKKVFGEVDMNATVLHFDGKLLPCLLQRYKVVDRLPVVIIDGDTEKLLGVPSLENGQGKTQAEALHVVLEDWGLTGKVKAVCCDTTISNMGHRTGAVVMLEGLLERILLIFPCRHHIYEIILKAAFETKLPLTTGPSVFKRFRDAWKDINVTKYQHGIDEQKVKMILTPNIVDRIVTFVKNQFKICQPSDDYKELLELTLVFLGVVEHNKVKIHPPGADHHARWMSKAIYCLNIFLFRNILL